MGEHDPWALVSRLAPGSSMTRGEHPPGAEVGVRRLWRVALSGTTGIPPSLIAISLATAAATLLQFFFFFFCLLGVFFFLPPSGSPRE